MDGNPALEADRSAEEVHRLVVAVDYSDLRICKCRTCSSSS